MDELPPEIQSLHEKRTFSRIAVKAGQTKTIEKGEEIGFKGAYSVQKVIYETDEIHNFCQNTQIIRECK